MPAFYFARLKEHYETPTTDIVGRISLAYSDRHLDQKRELTQSWETTVEILKQFFETSRDSIAGLAEWSILYEYPIPRREKRIDAVLISKSVIYVIEIKAGQQEYLQTDMRQVEGYALDLRDFHLESRDRIIVPILLCTAAQTTPRALEHSESFVKATVLTNPETLAAEIQLAEGKFESPNGIDASAWNYSRYMPTPTIVEAAQTLYATNSVEHIARNQAGIENLARTSDAVLNAIAEAQQTGEKIICFITGVPGAGKTLAGLNIVHGRSFQAQESDLGVFLSGNSPLVKVLREALTRDVVNRERVGRPIAEHRVGTFIQNVHTFIDTHYLDEAPPPDRVLIYDEAQRAWTATHKHRKSKGRISESEPDILLSIMSRFEGWAAIICLVGGGQEINTGEAGLREWGRSLESKFHNWRVYISPNLKEGDDTTGHTTLFDASPSNVRVVENESLHLNVAIRAIRSNKLSEFVSSVLNLHSTEAARLLREELGRYPIAITRDLNSAREWLRSNSHNGARTGIIASSGGRRLRAIGFDPYYGLRGDSDQKALGAWYLNPADDVRSSNFLEVVATEYATQGLEIDWAGILWDSDMRIVDNEWQYRAFKGTRWQNVDAQQKQYILNKYRVLLTRAREGMIVCVPKGNPRDKTRLPEFYDGTYEYLKSIGIDEL